MKYIVHKRGLLDTIQAFNSVAEIYYPVKSNANKKLISLMNPLICGFETESFFHARYLVKTFNVSPDRILFSAHTVSAGNIERLLSLQITHFVVDDMKKCTCLIEKAADQNKKLNIMFRLDILDVLKTDYVLKWGASLSDIIAMKGIIEAKNHRFSGISYYLPQEINTLENSIRIVDYLANRVGSCSIKTLNVGGGISCENLAKLADVINKRFGNNPQIIVEPGRSLLDPNIDLLVNIIDIREKKNQRLLFIDSGIYSGLIDCLIKKKRFEVLSAEKTGTLDLFLICGNSSDISDIIGSYHLPRDLRIGDTLLIKKCGAYCSEMDMDFCKDKRANYIVVDS